MNDGQSRTPTSASSDYSEPDLTFSEERDKPYLNIKNLFGILHYSQDYRYCYEGEMGEKLLLNSWPKNKRICNIGYCLAFHLTNQDWEDIIEGSRIVKKEGMKRAVEEMGVPVGTCKVTSGEVVVNSRCTATDNAFVDYYRK